MKLKKHEKLKKKIAAKAKKIKTEIKDGKSDKKSESKAGEREKSLAGSSNVPAEQSKPRLVKSLIAFIIKRGLDLIFFYILI